MFQADKYYKYFMENRDPNKANMGWEEISKS